MGLPGIGRRVELYQSAGILQYEGRRPTWRGGTSALTVNEHISLVVESGPDKGMEIAVPASGARLGRASGNDIVLTDPALSRFHCRFYFKDGRTLHVSDLASTNETLINGRPSVDGRLAAGDRVTIGQTTLRVIRDAPVDAAPSAPAAPSAAPAEPSAPPAAVPGPGGGSAAPAPVPPVRPPLEIDLGLSRSEEAVSPARDSDGAPALRRWLPYAAAAALMAATAAVSWRLMAPRRPSARPPGSAPAGGPVQLEIHYEKVEASPQNIFRYAVTLEGGAVSVRIDNLQNAQHISREKRADPKVLEMLATSLEQSGFFDLVDEYSGLTPGVWDLADLTIVVGRRAHRVRVLNRLQPDPFKKAREEIEEFVRNEMGLHALALPPEKLVELGRNAWLTGKKLYDERDVRYDNLARAIRSLTEAESLVDTLEPKPDFFEDAIALREEAKRQLQAKYEDYMFRADRAIKLNDWKEANTHLQVLLDVLADRADERYQKVYRKLVDVQRRLQRK